MPTGLNRVPQLAGSAVTVTFTFSIAASSFGFAVEVMPLKIGKNVAAAIAQPARMITLRPILSDSQPKTTKKPVPRSSDHAIRRLAV